MEKANKGTLVIELMHLPRTLTYFPFKSVPDTSLARDDAKMKSLTTSLYNVVRCRTKI